MSNLKVIRNPDELFKREFSTIVTQNASIDSIIAAEYHMVSSYRRSSFKKEPLLVISSIGEQGGILLGRFQNQREVLQKNAFEKYPVYRRFSGGSAVFLAKNSIYMFLIIPFYKNLINKQFTPSLRRTPRHFNRFIKKGLENAGLDFLLPSIGILTKKTSQIGGLSFDYFDSTLLIEGWIGMETSIEVPEDLQAYPPFNMSDWYKSTLPAYKVFLSPLPDIHTITDCIAKELLNEFNGAIKRNSPQSSNQQDSPLKQLEMHYSKWNWLDNERIQNLIPKIIVKYDDEYDSSLQYSGLIEDSVGYIQAAVSLTEDNLFHKIKIYGDFFVDSSAIIELEQQLKSTPAQKRNIALIIDNILGSFDHVIMGIKRLGSILEAIMDAVNKITKTTEKE